MADAILILDDGELADVARAFSNSEITFTRLRGAQISQGLAPPTHLLITTPRHAKAVRRGSPPGAHRNRPLRVIVTPEDSGTMRRMLVRMGFHLLVRRPTHSQTWRLLAQRAFAREGAGGLPLGNRRKNPRKHFSDVIQAQGPMGSCVLMGRDLSEGGMRIRRTPGIEIGQQFELAIYDPYRRDPLRIKASVVRDDKEGGFGLRFHDVDANTAAHLEKLVGSLPDVESLEEGEVANLGAVVAEVITEGHHQPASASP